MIALACNKSCEDPSVSGSLGSDVSSERSPAWTLKSVHSAGTMDLVPSARTRTRCKDPWRNVRLKTSSVSPSSGWCRRMMVTRKEESWVWVVCRKFLRCHRPRMASEVLRASNRRPTRTAPHQEMVGCGRVGGRKTDEREGRNATGWKCFTVDGKPFSALRIRSMGPPMEEAKCARRHDRRALCRRHQDWVSTPRGCRAVPGRTTTSSSRVQTRIAPRQNANDRVRAVCRSEST